MNASTRNALLTRVSTIAGLVPLLAACQPPDDDEVGSKGYTIGATDRIEEIDAEQNTFKSIENAPGNHLIWAMRVNSQGRRAIYHYDGTSYALFMNDSLLYPIDVAGLYVDGMTLLCAQVATAPPPATTGIQVICDVRRDGETSFASRTAVGGEPNAYLFDVCTGEAAGDFLLLIKSGYTPFWDDEVDAVQMEQSPCAGVAWDATTASWEATEVHVCNCELLDGKPCTDVCYDGEGVYAGGSCDLSAATFRCDDGNPDTDDYCTGDPADLCTHVPTVDGVTASPP